MKRCSTSLIIRKLQLQTNYDQLQLNQNYNYDLMSIRMTTIKKKCIGEDMKKLEAMKNSMAVPPKIKNRITI